MAYRLPKLAIHDEPAFSRWRIRFYDRQTGKEKFRQVSYGKTRSKEKAYEVMSEKRAALIKVLELEYQLPNQHEK